MRFIVLAAFFAVGFLPLETAAQTAAQAQAKPMANQPVFTLPALTVTATKTAEDPFYLPASIDVVSSATITQTMPASIGALFSNLPNIDLVGSPRAGSEQITIRGLDDRRIVIKTDGQRQNFRGEYKGRFFIDPDLLQRVEVVRGGNSVLDGSGAIAGTVQFVTKSADDFLREGEQSAAQSKFSVGSNGNEKGLTLIGAARHENTGALVALTRNLNNDIDLGDGRTLSYSDAGITNGLAKINFTPRAGHALTLTASSGRTEGTSYSNPFRDPPFAGNPVARTADERNLRVTYNYAPNGDNGTINITTNFYHGLTDVVERVIDTGPVGRMDKTHFRSSGFDVFNVSRFNAFDMQHAVTLGSEFTHDDQRGIRGGTGRDGLFPDADAQNISVYAQNQMRSGKWLIIPGVRFDHYELAADTGGTNNSDQRISAKLATDYTLDNQWGVFATLAQSFRAPLMVEAFVNGSLGGPRTLLANANLRPEVALNKEIGLRHENRDMLQQGDRMQKKITFFHNDIDDLIERQGNIGGNPNNFQYVNIAKARLYGIETSGTYFWGAHYTSLGLSFTRGQNRTQNQALIDVLPAKASWSIGTSMVDGINVWDAAWHSEFAAKQKRVPTNDLLITPAPGYAVHGFNVAWRTTDPSYDNVTLNFGADNLFDKSFRRQTAFIDDPGRNIKAALTIRF